MKKILLSVISFMTLTAGFSQHVNLDKSEALAMVKGTRSDLGFSEKQISDLIVAQSYSNPLLGNTYIYLQQTFKGVPVHNRIIVVAYQKGKLISKAGELFANAAVYSNSETATPLRTPQEAISAAVSEVKAMQPSFLKAPAVVNGKINFGTLDIAYEDVTAQLFWVPIEKKGQKTSLKLSWQIMLAPLKTEDMWYVRVDAQNNSVINKVNLTVFEDHPNHADVPVNADQALLKTVFNNTKNAQSPTLVGTANYLVIPYPVESPLYGTAATETNPWTMAGSFNTNAVSLKWHNDGANDYTISRGNNVWATEDRAGTNNGGTVTPTGLPATSSTTPDPLNFIFTPDYTVAPTTPLFQQFAITNLFYWNNVMHDISYSYGFDEVSGNFQANNQGRGGTQNDYVIAIAQSAAGTNNANFSTPADGGRPRMRMYLFTAPNPDRDGDIDNGIIAHEYTHGISNRFTGGVAGGGGCLSNAEQGGEGWSDYFGLMVTTNWATAQITDGFNIRRPIGNYALGQASTGNGFRSRPYSTNFAINNLTYAYVQTSGGQVHAIGEVWCSALWDMTWNMIQLDGINPNLFNSTAIGGNSAALKLVTEGMRLQPCSPGFIDGRNAILAADQLLYAGRYHCAIINAFARRGMGTDARQGSSGSTNDQTVGFSTEETTLTLTQSITQQQETLNVTYTNRVVAGPCSGVSNFNLTDTLPLNVTYVSGGTYNSGNRVVSFPVNLAAGGSQTYSFTVQINSGSYFPTVDLLTEPVASSTIPSTWTATTTVPAGGTLWTVSSAQSHSPPNSFFGVNRLVASDMQLSTNTPIALGTNAPIFSFWHKYDTEPGWDGGVVEISTNGGTTWTDLGANMTLNGYNGVLGAGTGNNLANRQAFTGASTGFIETKIKLTPFVNQNALFRFRCASDDNTASVGWFVDDILLRSQALVDIRSNLFNSSGVRVQIADTFTIIIPNTVCTPVTISQQPVNVTTCAGNNAVFTVTATGTAPVIQWQVSTDGGATFTNISGASSTTLTLTGVTVAMNNNRYRALVSNACPSSINSTAAVLTVTPGISITSQPTSTTVCAGATATFTVTAAGTTPSYQWQVSTNGGTTFADIAGATTPTLTIAGVTAAMNNNQYHVIVSNSCPSSLTSNNVTLTVQTAPAITAQPAAVGSCSGATANFSVTATGSNLTYQWQSSPTGCGGVFTNIAGANAATLTIPNVTVAMSGTGYRVIVSGVCTPASVTSNCVLLTVNVATVITQQPAALSLCAGASATFTTAATGSSITYQWQVSTDGGATFNNIAGATSPSLTINPVTAVLNGNQYRAVISSPCSPAGTNTSAATLTVAAPAAITAQPADVNTCATSATFTVTTSGTMLTYQWQVSVDGVTFTNIPGANSATLTLNNLSIAMSNYKYRVIVSNTLCGSVTSNAVSAKVGTTPSVVLTAAPPTGAPSSSTNPSHPSGLYTTVSPIGNYVYQWKRDGVILPVLTSSITGADLFNVFGVYRVTIFDVVTGCSAVSNTITLGDIAGERNRLFIYPNPTRGNVQIRFYSDDIAQQARMLTVFDSKGSRIITKSYNISGRYGRMDLDLTGKQPGVYMVELRNASGEKIASGSIIKN